MIKQLLKTVIAKYRDLTVSRRLVICLSFRLRQIIDLLATDKSRYFGQLRPIIVNYFVLPEIKITMIKKARCQKLRYESFLLQVFLLWAKSISYLSNWPGMGVEGRGEGIGHTNNNYDNLLCFQINYGGISTPWQNIYPEHQSNTK